MSDSWCSISLASASFNDHAMWKKRRRKKNRLCISPPGDPLGAPVLCCAGRRRRRVWCGVVVLVWCGGWGDTIVGVGSSGSIRRQ